MKILLLVLAIILSASTILSGCGCALDNDGARQAPQENLRLRNIEYWNRNQFHENWGRGYNGGRSINGRYPVYW